MKRIYIAAGVTIALAVSACGGGNGNAPPAAKHVKVVRLRPLFRLIAAKSRVPLQALARARRRKEAAALRGATALA